MPRHVNPKRSLPSESCAGFFTRSHAGTFDQMQGSRHNRLNTHGIIGLTSVASPTAWRLPLHEPPPCSRDLKSCTSSNRSCVRKGDRPVERETKGTGGK